MSEKEKVVAIVSGGMDSVAMLHHLVLVGYEVLVLNFSYGSKHNRAERACLAEVCRKEDVILYFYDLPIIVEKVLCYEEGLRGSESEFLLASNLLESGEDVPEGHYEEPNMKQTVVPFRNGIMLSIAAGFAESRGIDMVFYANHAGDHAVYPDCRQDFVERMDEAVRYGTYRGIRIISPFLTKTKSEIAVLGLEEGAPFEHTWTCYRGGEGSGRPCLKCSTCIERTEAFHLAGAQDPALTSEEWELALTYMKEAVQNWESKK